jgi:50S ribosomal subunit-associated GTPase HflX
MEQETGKIQRFILAAVCQEDEEETSRSLDELEELVQTAGGVSIGRWGGGWVRDIRLT